jgi:hypothetical protein
LARDRKAGHREAVNGWHLDKFPGHSIARVAWVIDVEIEEEPSCTLLWTAWSPSLPLQPWIPRLSSRLLIAVVSARGDIIVWSFFSE